MTATERAAGGSGPSPPLPRSTRFVLALLDRRRRVDYLGCALLGALPSVVAVLTGLDRSVNVDGVVWVGFLDKPNLWPQVVLLPLLLFLVRWTFGRVADVGTGERLPPVIGLLPPGPEREAAYERLRTYIAGPRTAALILGLVGVTMVLDVSGVARTYLAGTPSPEADWSAMWQIGVTDRATNLLLVIPAYAVQTALFVLRFTAIIAIGAHNLFFLRRVFQRRRAAAGRDALIPVDLDDEEHCLGLRGASPALNTQVVLLFLGGLGILLSRFANSVAADGLRWADLAHWPPRLPAVDVTPDAGQWILAVAWLVAIAFVSLPVFVKLLPLLGRGPDLTAREFLREFLDDTRWRAAEHRAEGDVTAALAARFAEHAFWPAGDNRAGILFTFWALVLLMVLYPVRVAEPSVLVAVVAVLLLAAWGIQRAGMALLAVPLRYVDTRLVTPAAKGAAAPRTRPLDLGVFVSYRRADARGWAPLLRTGLLRRLDAHRLFMDVQSLRDGEDFVDAIDRAIAASDVLLVVIGPDWLDARDAGGRRRLDDPDDFVVREVAAGLAAGREVIPVLVGNAAMPGEADLPPAIAALARRHARPLSETHWDLDVDRLLEALGVIEGERRGG